MERINHSINRDALVSRSEEARPPATTSSDLVLQWGNRKRLRCMKVQVKDRNGNNNSAGSVPVQRTAGRIDRRVVISDQKNNNKDSNINQQSSKSNGIYGYSNLRQRPSSPSSRILRNSENTIGMRGHSNGTRGMAFPDKGTANNNNSHRQNGGSGGSGSSENAPDGKKGGLSSGSDAIAAVWPPKFVIALTNKEKEEDFMAIKGSKLPQRPKKRTKSIQRTLNLVSPGAWLCDLTLERYDVREKKVSKKRPRGLRAMGNMDSDSE